MALNLSLAAIDLSNIAEVRECLRWFTREKQWINEVHLHGKDDIPIEADGRFRGPGVSDNGAGLAALLAMARARQWRIFSRP